MLLSLKESSNGPLKPAICKMSLILGSVNWRKCRIQLVIKQLAYFSTSIRRSSELLERLREESTPTVNPAFLLETVMVLRLGNLPQQPPFTGCCPVIWNGLHSFNFPNNPMKYLLLLFSILQLKKTNKQKNPEKWGGWTQDLLKTAVIKASVPRELLVTI